MAGVWRDLLIPPREVIRGEGLYSWSANKVRIEVWDTADEAAAFLISEALRASGANPQVCFGHTPHAQVRLLPSDLAPEHYRLELEPTCISISGDVAGRLYGAATLVEVIERNGLKRLPCGVVNDGPDFSRRALYYDCSRGKVPKVSTLEQLIPLLARWRINELQLYVEDVFTFHKHPGIGKDASPFKPADLLRIQDCCRQWHIEFVPSLASFGHMEKTLALKGYGHLGEKPGTHGYPGGTTLCPLDPGSIELVADLYSEFLPLFSSGEFNACGDEPWELGKGRCADVPGGTAGVYIEFLRKLQGLTHQYGKRMNVWADVILNYPDRLSEVPKDLVLLNWDYEANAERAARSQELAEAELPFLVCPGTHCWKSHGTRLQTAMENVTRSIAEARKWGADGVMNTNWGDSGHRNALSASMHSFAHGGAHGWNGAAVEDDTFTDRFCRWMTPGWSAAADLLRGLGLSQDRSETEPYFTAVQLIDLDRDAYAGIKPRSGAFWPPQYRKDWIGAGNAVAAREVRAELAPLLNARGPERFPGYLREMVMAANLERYALGRIATGQVVREGKAIGADRRALHKEGEFAIAEFATCWRHRNRTSRLKDNLSLLNNALAELR